MSKELEEFEEMYNWIYCNTGTTYEDDVKLDKIRKNVKSALQRLESIDNAKPSEVIKKLDDISYLVLNEIDDLKNKELWKSYFNTIKQALIKAQETEKENAYIEKIKTMMKQKDCVLRYIESDDCFAVKTILSDGWYKLTPEFVDNNVREEIKPLPLIEKNKQLKEENAEYKRVLEIIKKKRVDLPYLRCCFEDNQSEDRYNEYIGNKTIDYDHEEELTQEEFDLLKRWLG